MPNNNNKNPNFYMLYQEVGEIKGAVKAIDKKLDSVCDNHDKRLNRVESEVDQIKGKAAVIGGVAGFVVLIVEIVFDYIKKHI